MRRAAIVLALVLIGCGGEELEAPAQEPIEIGPLAHWSCQVRGSIQIGGIETHTWSVCGEAGAAADWLATCDEHASALLRPGDASCSCEEVDDPCTSAGATVVDEVRDCAPEEDEPGLELCGDWCVDTWVDPWHCGGCGIRCAPDEMCRGACVPAE